MVKHKLFWESHKKYSKSEQLKGFETEADTHLASQTIRAEVMHTHFIVQHNISFLTADYLSLLYA